MIHEIALPLDLDEVVLITRNLDFEYIQMPTKSPRRWKLLKETKQSSYIDVGFDFYVWRY